MKSLAKVLIILLLFKVFKFKFLITFMSFIAPIPNLRAHDDDVHNLRSRDGDVHSPRSRDGDDDRILYDAICE